MTDADLLQRYAETRDEAAFAEIVRRYADLVYSAARRQVCGDHHRAQEVTQMVFLALARKAAALARHPVLVAWLHRSTHLAAAKVRRSDGRRARREEAATPLLALEENAVPVDWTRTEPLLDDALTTLGEGDRAVVLLRFFSGRAYIEIGQQLGLSENAARMRTDRALEKLRRALAKRGVTSTASALGLALGANAVTAAPASVVYGVLGATSAAAAVVTGASATTGFFTLMTTSTKITLGVTATFIAVGLGWTARDQLGPTPIPASVVQLNAEVSSPARSKATSATANADTGEAGKDTHPTNVTVEALRKDLAQSNAELKRLRSENDSIARTLQIMIDEARDRVKAGMGQSIFTSLSEAGVFAAGIVQQYIELKRDSTRPPAPDESGYDDYQRRLEQLRRDTAAFYQDPLLIGEMQSKDPVRMSLAQASYVSPSLALNETQDAELKSILRTAYTEGVNNKLTLEYKPDGDSSAWEKARDQLNNRAVDRIKSMLTSAQKERFSEARYDKLIFHLNLVE